MLVKSTLLGRKVRSLFLRIFHYLENDDNPRIETNGEGLLIRQLARFFRDEPRLVMFDVGANVGSFSDLLLRIFRADRTTLHVFEPMESSFNALEEKFGAEASVILNKKAASDRTGAATVYFDQGRSGFASLHKRNLSAYGISMDKSQDIETVRLDDYIRGREIGHINFMKLDIEGHEPSALRGLGKYLDNAFIDFLQFEYGGANLDSGSSLMQLYDMLENADFRIAKIMRGGIELRNYRPWMDNFHYSNYIAVSKRILTRLS